MYPELRPLSVIDYIERVDEFAELIKDLSRRTVVPTDVLLAIQNPMGNVFAVFLEGQLIGTATGLILPHPLGRDLYVHDVVVLHAFQSQGIGTMLDEQLIVFARENRCTKIVLTNSPSKESSEFYRKRGYTPRVGENETVVWEKPIAA